MAGPGSLHRRQNHQRQTKNFVSYSTGSPKARPYTGLTEYSRFMMLAYRRHRFKWTINRRLAYPPLC